MGGAGSGALLTAQQKQVITALCQACSLIAACLLAPRGVLLACSLFGRCILTDTVTVVLQVLLLAAAAVAAAKMKFTGLMTRLISVMTRLISHAAKRPTSVCYHVPSL